MGKSAILKKIHNAAKNYQSYLAGKTFGQRVIQLPAF